MPVTVTSPPYSCSTTGEPMSPWFPAAGFPLGPLTVSTATLTEHVEAVRRRAAGGAGGWLVTLNTEMLARMAHDPDYAALLAGADLCVADGMPLVWASRQQADPRRHIPERTTGVDLVDRLLSAAAPPPFAILGGRDPLATLAQRYPRARRACRYCYTGRVDGSETQAARFARELAARDVRLVFLALGVPKQDRLAAALRARLPQAVLIGVGGSFEILGPDGRRAPRWMQRSGLEWLYRFVREPGRLWRRYLVQYPAGIRYLLRHTSTG